MQFGSTSRSLDELNLTFLSRLFIETPCTGTRKKKLGEIIPQKFGYIRVLIIPTMQR